MEDNEQEDLRKQPIDTGSWDTDLEQLLLNATAYSGTAQPGDRTLSASSIGKELYYNVLQVKYGKTNNQTKYGANTTGSLYQRGLDSAIAEFGEPGRYTTAERFKEVLPNGWTVSGEYDILDHKYKMVIDGKLLSLQGYNKAILNDINSEYNLQLATYTWMAGKHYNEHLFGALHVVNKGGSVKLNNVMKNLELFIHDTDYVIDLFMSRGDKIDKHLNANTMPTEEDEKCNILAYGKSNGVINRCNFYCDYKNVCPRFAEENGFQLNKQVRNIGDSLKRPVQKQEKYTF